MLPWNNPRSLLKESKKLALVGVTRRGRIYHGWYIVAVTFISNAVSGIGGFPFGLFFVPMGASLGWSRTAMSWALTIRAVSSMSMGPALGPLLDRKHGPQLVMVFGGVLLGVFIMLTGAVNQLWQFYLLFGVGYGASSAMMSSDMLTPTIISKWFIRLRGRALAISVMGMSLGGVMFIPLASFIILSFGWREAWLVLGLVGLLLVAPPSALFIRRTPEDIGLLPDGDAPLDAPVFSGAGHLVTDRAWTLREAVRTPSLWVMVTAFSIGSAGLGGFVVHAIPFMTDSGYSDVRATTYLVLFSIAAAMVKPVWGILGERFQVRYLVAAAFAISGTGMLVLATLNGGLLIGITLVAYGGGAGAFLPLMNLMWANYYGRASLGTIRGVFLPATQIILALSPVFAGYVFDITGSYSTAFFIFGILFLFGMVAILTARPPRAPSGESTQIGAISRL